MVTEFWYNRLKFKLKKYTITREGTPKEGNLSYLCQNYSEYIVPLIENYMLMEAEFHTYHYSQCSLEIDPCIDKDITQPNLGIYLFLP